MSLNDILKLELKIRKTNVKVKKIDNFIIKIFEIVIANIQIEKKVSKP